jgi:uncharacterized protein
MMTKAERKALAFAIAVLVAGPAVAGPSFDCAKAGTTDEKTICADPVLTDIDVAVTAAYATFEPSFQPKATVARLLLADRRQCGDDAACIAAVQSGSLDTFGYGLDNPVAAPWIADYAAALIGRKAAKLAESGGAPTGRIPAAPGQCMETRITEVTTRFGAPLDYNDAEEGTAVSFSDDIGQVSYGREEALTQAKAGDRVVLCLMSIPRDCPKGDVRGRLYLGYDADAKTQWILPDSQHLCGGA